MVNSKRYNTKLIFYAMLMFNIKHEEVLLYQYILHEVTLLL